MPKPTKFLTNEEIELKANEILDKYAQGGYQSPDLPVDIDALTECHFRFHVVWEQIEEPPGCQTFATIEPTLGNGLYNAKLTLNERFLDFLTEHPEIEGFTRAHELAHWILHIDEGKERSGLLPFADEGYRVRFHRSVDTLNSVGAELRNRLAKYAATNDEAYFALKPHLRDLGTYVEPDWVHRQAEHFASCLLVPRPALYQALEIIDDPAHYGNHVKLAERFRVSKRVLQIRLVKLGIIEETGGGKYRSVTSNSRIEFQG
jgi:hypothetical protein